ncbi:MAG TPA: DUF1464 family protein [Gemmatimonadaceae bacterium]|nr:DUF1464 family protein [Gemmatimonadaceae bacterium]
MTRAIGIDPGTVSIDLCGLEDGALVLDRSLPTAVALADPAALIALLERGATPDCIAGPSGYGLPVTAADAATDEELRLAFLAAPGEGGGIGGLRALARTLAASGLRVVFTPGVIHLPSVPTHRKLNRVDLGTADKVCAAALGIVEQARREECPLSAVSFVLLELGGAFTAALAVDGGRIVDGAGGSAGPMGLRAPGALDAEVAFLAGTIPKSLVFGGGAAAVWGDEQVTPERFGEPRTAREHVAFDAYVEGAVKAVATMLTSVPAPREILLSGRMAGVDAVREAIIGQLAAHVQAPVRTLAGFATVATHAAQGAALIADGLAGGTQQPLVETLGIREASGTVLDHLYVIALSTARHRLGLA